MTFLDGSTTIGSVWLTTASNVATPTTSSLAAGTHSITAIYAGDANAVPSTSNAISEVVDGFTLSVPVASGTSTTPTVTSQPGGTVVFTFIMSPAGTSTFLSPVTLTVNLPQTAELTQPAIGQPAAGSTLAGNTTGHSATHMLAVFALALVLLPFTARVRRVRKHLGRLMPVLLLLAALGAAAGLSGCGVTSHEPSYNVTMTATSGVVVHSTGFTLTIE